MSKKNNLPKIEYYTLEQAAKVLKQDVTSLLQWGAQGEIEICVNCSHRNTEHLDPEKKSVSHIFPNSDFFNKRFEFTDASFLQVGYDEIKRVIISSSKNESIWLLKSDNSSYWDIWNKDNFNFFLVIPTSELFKVEKNQKEISLHTAVFPTNAGYTVEDVNDGTLYKGSLPAICFSGGVTVSIENNLYVMASEIERFRNEINKKTDQPEAEKIITPEQVEVLKEIGSQGGRQKAINQYGWQKEKTRQFYLEYLEDKTLYKNKTDFDKQTAEVVGRSESTISKWRREIDKELQNQVLPATKKTE